MANTSSAKKAKRVALRRRVYNLRSKKTMKDAVKDISSLIGGKKAADAQKMIPMVFQAIDKAAKTHVIHKNAAARMKSRIAKNLAALTK